MWDADRKFNVETNVEHSGFRYHQTLTVGSVITKHTQWVPLSPNTHSGFRYRQTPTVGSIIAKNTHSGFRYRQTHTSNFCRFTWQQTATKRLFTFLFPPTKQYICFFLQRSTYWSKVLLEQLSSSPSIDQSRFIYSYWSTLFIYANFWRKTHTNGCK